MRKSNSQPEAIYEQKVVGISQHHNVSSTKPLLRSSSPREAYDERDPDVIPAKYGTYLERFGNMTTNLSMVFLGSPDGESVNQIGTTNGPACLPNIQLSASPSFPTESAAAQQWINPGPAQNMDVVRV